MFRNSLYKVVDASLSDPGYCRSILSINKDHELFKGHFPGKPVMPGVCMIEILKEILETTTQVKLSLKSTGNIKFLSILDPLEFPLVEIEINYNLYEPDLYIAKARIFLKDKVFFKMDQGRYIKK